MSTRRLGSEDDVPDVETDWTSLPAEEVPPWRRTDRERLDRARAVPPAKRGSEVTALAGEIRRLAALNGAGALSDEELVAALRALLG
jgi:hypothetical protein